MTIRFLVDENFNHKALAGIKRREPDLDIVAVREVALRSADDPDVLEWAAHDGRIVVTHDVTTSSVFAFDRVAAGLPMPGVVEIPKTVPMGQIIDELILIAGASKPDEWKDKVRYLPLR